MNSINGSHGKNLFNFALLVIVFWLMSIACAINWHRASLPSQEPASLFDQKDVDKIIKVLQDLQTAPAPSPNPGAAENNLGSPDKASGSGSEGAAILVTTARNVGSTPTEPSSLVDAKEILFDDPKDMKEMVDDYSPPIDDIQVYWGYPMTPISINTCLPCAQPIEVPEPGALYLFFIILVFSISNAIYTNTKKNK